MLACASCGGQVRTFELDGERLAVCRGCIADVVTEAGALEAERERLYDGASWSDWLHQGHDNAIVGCPICGRVPRAAQ